MYWPAMAFVETRRDVAEKSRRRDEVAGGSLRGHLWCEAAPAELTGDHARDRKGEAHVQCVCRMPARDAFGICAGTDDKCSGAGACEWEPGCRRECHGRGGDRV